MQNHIVTYDLCAPKRDYDRIISAIDVYDSVRLTESCWLIRSNNTADAVRDYLKNFIDSDDKLAVITLGADWASYNIEKVATNWLYKYV